MYRPISMWGYELVDQLATTDPDYIDPEVIKPWATKMKRITAKWNMWLKKLGRRP